MTLTNPKPLGWAFGELLTSGQMNSIATQLPYALDGANGGPYTLSAPLSIDGDTVTIDQLVAPNISGVTTFANDVVLADDLFVTDDASVTGDLSVAGSATIGDTAADFLTVNAAASFYDAMTVDGPVILNGLTTANGAATFGDLAINGSTAIGNSASDLCTVNARVIDSYASAAMGGTTTLGAARFLTLTGASSLSTAINSTGAQTNQIVFIYNSSTFTQTFTGDFVYAGFPAQSGAALRFNGTTWVPVNAWTFVP
jgi:hypothetical protein